MSRSPVLQGFSCRKNLLGHTGFLALAVLYAILDLNSLLREKENPKHEKNSSPCVFYGYVLNDRRL